MQIALSGCTGAGKSTLAKAMVECCQKKGIDASMGDDIVLKRIKMHWIKSYLVRSFLMNVAGLFGCLASVRANVHLYLYVARIVWELPKTVRLREKLNIGRNAYKKIGIYEIVKRCTAERDIVFVDEGTLQIIHNLFVHVSVEPARHEISTFVQLVPLPDVSVYVRQESEVLIERTLKRGHNRVPDNTVANVRRFVRHAVATFEEILDEGVLEGKLLVVDGTRGVVAPNDVQNHVSLRAVYQIVCAALNCVGAEADDAAAVPVP